MRVIDNRWLCPISHAGFRTRFHACAAASPSPLHAVAADPRAPRSWSQETCRTRWRGGCARGGEQSTCGLVLGADRARNGFGMPARG